MQIMCNINNVCVEIPFRVEWPTITKEKRIDKIPNVLNKTGKNLSINIEKIINIKPVVKRIADLPDKVSKDNIINEISITLWKSPPKFPATDRNTNKPVNNPKMENFFIKFWQYILTTLSKKLLKWRLNKIVPIVVKTEK